MTYCFWITHSTLPLCCSFITCLIIGILVAQLLFAYLERGSELTAQEGGNPDCPISWCTNTMSNIGNTSGYASLWMISFSDNVPTSCCCSMHFAPFPVIYAYSTFVALGLCSHCLHFWYFSSLIFSHFPSLFPAFPSPFLLSVPTFLVHKSLKKSGQIAYPSWSSHRLSVEIIILPTLLSVFLCVVFRHCSLLPIHLYIGDAEHRADERAHPHCILMALSFYPPLYFCYHLPNSSTRDWTSDSVCCSIEHWFLSYWWYEFRPLSTRLQWQQLWVPLPF